MADDLTPTTEALDERPAGEAGVVDAPETHVAAAEDTRDADDKGDEGDGKAIPYGRFKKVNEQLAGYRKLGLKPEEIVEKLKAIDEFVTARNAALEERKREEAARNYDGDREKRKAQLAALLDELEPGTVEAIRQAKRDQQLNIQRHGEHGFQVLKGELEKHDLGTDPETTAWYDKHLAVEINADEKLHEQYWNPSEQADAIRTAFGRIRDQHNRVLMKAGAAKMEDLARRRGATLSRATGPMPTPSATTFTPKAKPGSIAYEREVHEHEANQIAAIYDNFGQT